MCVSQCILQICVCFCCVSMCGWVGDGLDMFGDALWDDGSQQLPFHFTKVTWWWMRRAHVGMWSARLILHLPCPGRVALFISVWLTICFCRSQRLPFYKPHQVHIRQSEVLLQNDMIKLHFSTSCNKGSLLLCKCFYSIVHFLFIVVVRAVILELNLLLTCALLVSAFTDTTSVNRFF